MCAEISIDEEEPNQSIDIHWGWVATAVHSKKAPHAGFCATSCAAQPGTTRCTDVFHSADARFLFVCFVFGELPEMFVPGIPYNM